MNQTPNQEPTTFSCCFKKQSSQPIDQQPTSNEKQCCNSCKNCWKNHHPRIGYFYTTKACDKCMEVCDRPGIGSKDFQGGKSDECPLCCLPCTIIADILCCIPITFGCFTVENNN